LDDRRGVPAKLAWARHLRQFDLGRLGDFDGLTIIVDHLHDYIEFPVLNGPKQAGATVPDQDNLEGVRIVMVPSLTMCSCGISRKPGTDQY
jgi:hypothetical protein